MKTLVSFGLSENEARVYQECLKEDNLGPFKLAKLTNIPRTTIYEVLMSLSLKGLVELEQSDGFTKQQTKVKAKNPSVLREIIAKKREKLAQLEVDVVEMLPGLNGDYFKSESNVNFQFFPGIEGLKKVYLGKPTDVKMPIHAFENLMSMDVMGRLLVNKEVSQATATRGKSETKEIVVLNDWGKHVLGYQTARDENYLRVRQIRAIDGPGFFLNQRIAIQGDYVRISTAKNNEVWGLIVRSPSLAQTMESMFQFVWQRATPVTLELVRSWGKNEFYEAEQKLAKK